MSRCRYNLSEECHNKDCVKCILESIKEEIHKRINIQYDACFGDRIAVDCYHTAYKVSHIIVDNVFEEYVKELNNE